MAAPAHTLEARTARLDAQMRDLVEGQSTPGIVALILQNGRLVHSRAVGTREPGGTAPIGTDDLFRYASMTKPVTSVAVLILAEEGRIGLDDPLDRHLPQFGSLRVRQADGTLVPVDRTPAIRDLLTHTAGFSYNIMNRPGIVNAYRDVDVGDGLSDLGVTTEEAMGRLAAAPLAYQPGAEWHYSLATDVLGALVERVTGQSLGEFVARRIAGPLGLNTWAFNAVSATRDRFVPLTRPAQVTGALGTGVVPVTAAERVPLPITGGEALIDPERIFSATAYHSGGAGLSGDTRDYARFAQMLLNGGELDGVRILAPETVRRMTENQIGELPVAVRGPGWGFGLGVAVLTDPTMANTGCRRAATAGTASTARSSGSTRGPE
jgi:CubicO group peptidase (beta-lactamase class C family)